MVRSRFSSCRVSSSAGFVPAASVTAAHAGRATVEATQFTVLVKLDHATVRALVVAAHPVPADSLIAQAMMSAAFFMWNASFDCMTTLSAAFDNWGFLFDAPLLISFGLNTIMAVWIKFSLED